MAINIIMNRWCSPGRLTNSRISSLLHQLIKLEIINIPKKPCWMIFNMIPLPMHSAIASHRDKKGPGSRFEMRSEYSAVTKTSLFVTKITFVVAEMIFKVTVMAYLMAKFTSAVTEITFFRGWHKIVSGQDHFCSGWENIKVAVITSSEPRSLCSGLDIFFSGWHQFVCGQDLLCNGWGNL